MKIKNVIYIIVSIILILVTYSITCLYKDCTILSSGDKYIHLYKGLLSYLIENNSEYLDDAEYIAVDANSFKITSELDKKLLIEHLQEYNDKIILASYDMLNDKEYIDENGVLSGVFISASELEFVFNTVTCEYTMYKGPLASVGYNTKSTYNYDNWKIKYKAFLIS